MKTQTVWFIENQDNEWYMGGIHWTRDPLMAMQHDTEEEAIETICYKNLVNCKPTEHMFPPLNADQTQEGKCDKCTDRNGQNIGDMYVCDKCGRAVS